MRFPSLYSFGFSLLLLVSSAVSQLRAHDGAREMADAASAFIASLSAEQKQVAIFPFESDERLNWHFVPKERKGLPFKEMSQEQSLLGYALLSTGLSQRGFVKATSIMSLEEILYQLEGKDESRRAAVRARRDPEKYFFSIFGEPGMSGLWGWRVEGHHLSLNFTVKDGHLLRATPTFFGTNPAEVREGPRAGLKVLAQEEALGRKLAQQLNAEQWAKAQIDTTAYKDILTGAARSVSPLSPNGISEADLNAEQKTALHQLVREHLGRIRPDVAEEVWKEIQESGPIFFAWAGEREVGKPHYYRAQGKTFLLEYDNTQNHANHIHVAWRDFDGDFGADLLQAHIEASHKK